MFKTTYFCGWMLVNLVDMKQTDKFREMFILIICEYMANFCWIVSGG